MAVELEMSSSLMTEMLAATRAVFSSYRLAVTVICSEVGSLSGILLTESLSLARGAPVRRETTQIQ